MALEPDPVYVYVRGQGWIVSSVPEYTTVYCTKDGKRYLVTVQKRPPETGEHYYTVNPNDTAEGAFHAIAPDLEFRPLNMGGTNNHGVTNPENCITIHVVEL